MADCQPGCPEVRRTVMFIDPTLGESKAPSGGWSIVPTNSKCGQSGVPEKRSGLGGSLAPPRCCRFVRKRHGAGKPFRFPTQKETLTSKVSY